MMKKIRFPSGVVDLYPLTPFSKLKEIVLPSQVIIITDEHVLDAHHRAIRQWKHIVIKAGELHKVQRTADEIIRELIDMGAERDTVLVGVGGGVVTDMTGYVASIYLRGISFGFVPTSLLGMVDACIGGKTGINVDVYKNMVGTFRQPGFILYDPAFLKTLPDKEWRNGFAEVIKHASILDKRLFAELENCSIDYFRKKRKELEALIIRNVQLKTGIVRKDERERKERKLLNFGHTIGHALENLVGISHGEAISIGMYHAARVSEKYRGFKEVERLKNLLQQYGLPVEASFDPDEVMQVMQKDKKRKEGEIQFILLKSIGKAEITPLRPDQIRQVIE